ncbi:protein O-GlcNAcase [Thalassophryne amazonica]|uniref:protein O-GlcNAcase n=1 Tax=Thalassophryne amazonica TaxID=390379 RepID=UPI0014719FB4|nr:protein O-GlcNAcase [Thalassophryne amazonica]XP_034020357.1 protein O-GlcNAcase [Thalassophryne amazonica]XP_034020358.1 protein O-GlcNAcase [Thalassophryne amazonica]XP_034020359.1 protein O-GlcNAcase [Thalassophryne amazonica]
MEEEKQFLCGVVEGFYGRPWCMDQRKVLFQWMQRWGLNTYLYGPKDDLKHRLLWREVYSPEEEAQLRTLIVEAESRGLRFVYALSPGQDIVFSSSCDVTLLKRKLRQVSDLGCQAFAILFDDIDHSMCQADSEAFSSFAHAQVAVTNEIYQYLGEPPVFLFCPTEYCGSLCSPSVSKSSYLQTVGEDLLPDITVIWTGSKVISKKLSADCLVEVESVLQRPPLIWDNLHANDYDSRRLFLGPFKGRDPQLRSYLRGLLLNPNCEFEANYIPLHTLGSWYRAGKEEMKAEEYEYCPDRALSAALHDWMEELNQPLQAGRQGRQAEQRCSAVMSRSKTPDRSDCPASFRGTSAVAKPLPVFPLNSSSPPSSPTKAKGDRKDKKKRSNQSGQPNHQSSESRPGTPSSGSRGQKGQGRGLCGGKSLLSESQVQLLVGLHYLPHEHGLSAEKLLQDLTWLKTNCHVVSANSKKVPAEKVEEWRGRASRFLSLCEDIAQLHCSVVGGTNRAVLYDLYPYVWDLRNMALVAKAFICWLDGRVLNDGSTLPSWRNCFQWCGKSTGPDLLGVESEPWVFKGGVSGEVQMLLPTGGSSELFTHPPPLFPTSRLYNIRPYHSKDKLELYRLVRQLHLRSQGGPETSAAHPDVIGDRCLGPCLALCPEYSFILEDELGVCGCVLGILDVRSFAKRCQATWMPAMRDKYPPKGGSTHSNTENLLQLMEEDQGEYPDSLLYHFPSQVRLDALPELVDISVSRTLLTAILTALKANGSPGVFCEVQPTDHQRLEFLTKLGFLEILRGEARSREGVVLGRLL